MVKIKEFESGSMKAVLKMMRAELGDQAVILRTRTLRTRTLFGLIKTWKYRVTAADQPVEPKWALEENQPIVATPTGMLRKVSKPKLGSVPAKLPEAV